MSTTIKLSNSKDTELEFDVAIQGLTEETAAKADVRFVIANADGKFNMSVGCVKSQGTKWLARIPAPKLQESSQDFRVEVIVDGYYFEPAAGKLQLISEPTVGITENVSAPVSVTAAFSQPTTVSTRPIEKPLLESLVFNKDPRFAKQFNSATKVAMKSINIIEQSIAKTGEVDKKNKAVVAEAIETGKKIFAAMEYLFYKKKK